MQRKQRKLSIRLHLMSTTTVSLRLSSLSLPVHQGDITMVAALTLTQLALGSEENCMDIRAHGGIEKLMRLLRSCSRSSDILRVALGALLNLSNHTKVRIHASLSALSTATAAPVSSRAAQSDDYS